MNNGHNTFSFNEDARYSPYVVTGLVARVRPGNPDNDFAQPGTLFRKVMCEQSRKNTIFNLVTAMKGVRQDIAERVVKMFYKADPELGDKLAQGLGFPAVSSRL
jgi:catalase